MNEMKEKGHTIEKHSHVQLITKDISRTRPQNNPCVLMQAGINLSWYTIHAYYTCNIYLLYMHFMQARLRYLLMPVTDSFPVNVEIKLLLGPKTAIFHKKT